MSSRSRIHPDGLASSTANLLPPFSPRRVFSASASLSSGYASSGYADSISDKYSFAPDPESWGPIALHPNVPEPDDFLHNPDPIRDRRIDNGGHVFTSRGILNLGCLLILATGCVMLFAGYPILIHFLTPKQTNQGGFNLGGTNATGQVPAMRGNFGLIDLDTPKEAYSKKSYMNPNDEWDLVFSDEFNTDGRSFYPGDDPFWEAPDLHYWQTNDLEWYDPSQVTTAGGSLRLTLDKIENTVLNHNLGYRSGMVQTWNKFCFTGGLIETAVILPGTNHVTGLWPAVWTMGNLGRAGFGATLEGMWPYSYDSCDVGTLPNQTYPGTATPLAAVQNGDKKYDGVLSYLPGQRLSACTCPGESHPGPMRTDGQYVGRAAPEIDIFEATIEDVGKVSQSAQWAPFNAEYIWLNNTDNLNIYDPTVTNLNNYKGGAFQQTTSGLTITNQDCYELEKGCSSVYGFEYVPGFDNAYITWISDGKPAWTIRSAGMAADTATEIGARPIPQEPMYIIANLGFSLNFGGVDFEQLTFPTSMLVDYIRVYQPRNAHNIGCDPPNFPTRGYIDKYIYAYTNPNLTTWQGDYKQPIPRNRLNGSC